MRPVPEIDDTTVVFGGADAILPAWHDIPDEFKPSSSSSFNGQRHYSGKRGVTIAAKWIMAVEDWFFHGLHNAVWTPKPGVNTKQALRAVAACISDWGPSHEHKTAGCAYLLSEWFEQVTYSKAK